MKRAGIISKALGRARRKEPIDVVLTLKMNFGDDPADVITLLQNRRVPLVGSIFENRDRIAREFIRLLLKAGALQPRAMRRLMSSRRADKT